jgi:hypothetical protein
LYCSGEKRGVGLLSPISTISDSRFSPYSLVVIYCSRALSLSVCVSVLVNNAIRRKRGREKEGEREHLLRPE